MSDCNGASCRDWIITLARDGCMTSWGWVAIATLVAAMAAATWTVIRLLTYVNKL